MRNPRVFGAVSLSPSVAWSIGSLVFLLVADARFNDSTDAFAQTLVIRNAQIHTMTDAGVVTGTIVIEEGKVTSVGEEPQIPTGARVIDATGLTVVPGLIDSRSGMWLSDLAKDEQSNQASLDVVDGLQFWQQDWREAAVQGVTTVYVQPNRESRLGGFGAVLRAAPADSIEDLVIQPRAAVQASLGLAGGSSRDRYQQFERLQRALQAVKDGKSPPSLGEIRRQTTQQEPTTGRGRGRGGFGGRGAVPTRTSAPELPDRTKLALESVINDKTPLRVEVVHPDTLRWALTLATEFGIEVVLEGCDDPGRAPAELAQSGTPVVLGPKQIDKAREAASRGDNDSLLHQLADRSSRFVLSPFDDAPRSSSWLRIYAAQAVSAGIDRDQVLRSITIDAARLLGVDDRIGSIVPDRLADLVVFAGDPLDPAVPARLVISRGQVVHEDESNVAWDTIATSENASIPEELPSRYVIESDRILVDGRFVSGRLVVGDGTIEAVGEAAEAPANYPVFDMAGVVVTPGLVVAHSYLGQRDALTDLAESDASHLRSVDGFDATVDSVQDMRNGGFLHVALAPSSTNTSAGVVGQVNLGRRDAEANLAIASKFVLTEEARSSTRFPASLGGQIELLESLFAGNHPDVELFVPDSVAKLLQAERESNLNAIIDGERRALVAAQTRAEIEAALRIIAAHPMKATLLGAEQLDGLVDRLVSADIGVIARPTTAGDYRQYADRLAALAQAGVPIAFAGETPDEVRTTAALAVNSGAPRDVVLLGLTRQAADLSGMPVGTGQLSVGQPASFVLWNGSPIDLTARVLRVVVEGEYVD